ncbi:sterol O-acyltransferase 2-like isoform X2 [Photinus pyralis]|uniref:sterol O-acyltransferase 2-like isoform X2 n=1 Tax=Photinus pyralis TaxID=7054 RepID=UPI001266ECC6|nr:sterol O-acyltransferase 2-like isoform X2 [Photinus pyralis]
MLHSRKIQERCQRTRIFKTRESLLTIILEGRNGKAIYNVFPGIFLLGMLYSALKDYQREGRPYFGTRLLRSSFAQFDVAAMIWIPMFGSCLLVYFFFALWKQGRQQTKWKCQWDKLFVSVFGLYVLVLPHLVAFVTVSNNLGPASSLAVMLEMVRLLMKSYAFVRSNTKSLEHKQGGLCPSFSHYLYFLFAPTLIYSDNYPRTNKIRWSCIAISFAEITAIILLHSVLVENTYVYYLQNYGKRSYSFLEIITCIVECAFSGHVSLIMIFYSFHSYFNATAELTRFSDRLFYLDWWTAENLDEFLRGWSYFVHEWLHVYIYRDCHEILFPSRKLLAKIVVLVLSGYFHDLILCVASRTFLPLTIIEFVSFVWMRVFLTNKMILGLLGMEVSCAFTILMMEYYARLNCPMPNAGVIQYLMPRFLYC